MNALKVKSKRKIWGGMISVVFATLGDQDVDLVNFLPSSATATPFPTNTVYFQSNSE